MRADVEAEYVVPTALRRAMVVPWQAPGRREPARVTAGAFQAAGLPVPEHPGQRNIYQLTRRQGLPWSPGLDMQIRRRGGELLGHGNLVLVDIDTPAAVDGMPLVDAVRWLADRAVEGGGLLDLSGSVSVRTPGHCASGHLPGWHLWYRADPARPVHLGPLDRCHAIELRGRGTCPGSPGYLVCAHPDDLPALPRWIADLAGPPPAPVTTAITGRGGAHAQARLHEPPRSGWLARTGRGRSQPPSGPGSTAPAQPMSPPDHLRRDHRAAQDGRLAINPPRTLTRLPLGPSAGAP